MIDAERLLLLLTWLTTWFVQIIHFYLQLQTPTIVVKKFYAVLLSCWIHITFTRAQSQRQWPENERIEVSTSSYHFIGVGKNLLSASIMLQFSLPLLERGDNSRLFFFRQKAGLCSLLTWCKCPFFSFSGQRKARGLVTQHIQQGLQILSAHNDKTYP